MYNCTIKITESSNRANSNSDPQELEFPAEKDPLDRTNDRKLHTPNNRFGTRTTPTTDTLRRSIRRKTNDESTDTGTDTAGYIDIELSNTAEKRAVCGV